MKLLKSVSALLLAAAILLSVGACGGSSGSSSADTTGTAADISETTTGTTELRDNVPELDFEGYEFRILTSATTSSYTVTVYEEQTGEVLEDAMYERCKNVSERLNIVFAPDNVQSDSSAALSTMRNFVSAGDDAYDLCMQLGRSCFAMTSAGYFLDMSELPYIETDRPWWFYEINSQINITGHEYIMFSALTLGVYDFMNVMLFNKNMAADFNMESPYSYVADGTWVFDVFAGMAREATADLDGDGEMTKADRYGLTGRANSMLANFITGARQRTVEVNEEDRPTLAIEGNQRIFDVFDKVNALVWDDGVWYSKTNTENNYYVAFPFFEDGQALFADRSFRSITYLRSMEDDFGVIPFPKYDEAQDEYGTMTEAGSRLMVVPATAGHHDVIGAAIETLSFYSHKLVIPAYYEISLKEKFARDTESQEILDLAVKSLFYDMGNTMFCSSVKDGVFRIFFNGGRDLASSVASQTPAFEAAVKAALGE